jgi:hypothetical protein
VNPLPIPMTEEMKRYYTLFAKLRVIALYRPTTDDFMVAIHQDGKYRISFIDQYGLTTQTTTMILIYDDISAKTQAAIIARIIGATLIEEVQG